MHNSLEKLAVIRNSMKESCIDALIIPNTDPHLCEYVPDHWRIISWLTGFTGSAATVVITGSFAGLWTDSRYFIQAEKQLIDTGFELNKRGDPDIADYTEWIARNLEDGSRVGFDGRTFSIKQKKKLEVLTKEKKIVLRSDFDIISAFWNDRPPMSSSPAFDHPVEYCGKGRALKIAEVREQMKKIDVDYHLLTSPDDIMWLLNIRGNDVNYSPLLSSFAIIGEEQVLFFADENKVPVTLANEFDKLNIVMLPYEETAGIISALPSDSSILINPGTISVSLYESIPPDMRIAENLSIPSILKSIKNKIEIENIGKVMLKDGVALTKFFFWLENNIGKEQITELSLADKILEFRSIQSDFLEASFSTIAAFNEHGALPHYTATPDSSLLIEPNGILLIDSGGQYLDGTTDITRTIATGVPAGIQIKDFTLVLKGMISIALAKFPLGTKGYQLDTLARKALWENGLNYGHGTGHGVGFCLNVHEGPQSISPAVQSGNQIILEPGMLISDEPAVYREGKYGIRTENLMVCYEDEETEFGQFLKFDTVSLCYIDKTLIDESLLDQKEIEWLNAYHSEIYEKLSPLLSPEEKRWLENKTNSLHNSLH